jgi:hypothetical protein
MSLNTEKAPFDLYMELLVIFAGKKACFTQLQAYSAWSKYTRSVWRLYEDEHQSCLILLDHNPALDLTESRSY